MIDNLEKNNKFSRNAIMAIASIVIFLIACTFGEGLGGSLGYNQTCFKYLGCTTGFLGYDALEHFLFGIATIFTLVWFFKRFPDYSVLNSKRWKNVLILIALVALIAVLWELSECAYDFFRGNVLNLSLFDLKTHVNLLAQPNNLDTMGDFTSGLIGAITATFFVIL